MKSMELTSTDRAVPSAKNPTAVHHRFVFNPHTKKIFQNIAPVLSIPVCFLSDTISTILIVFAFFNATTRLFCLWGLVIGGKFYFSLCGIRLRNRSGTMLVIFIVLCTASFCSTKNEDGKAWEKSHLTSIAASH